MDFSFSYDTELRDVANLRRVVRQGFGIGEAIFVHDPIGSGALRGFPFVENQSFLHANKLTVTFGAHNLLVQTSGLPVARAGGSV